jgi:hypothetical protein
MSNKSIGTIVCPVDAPTVQKWVGAVIFWHRFLAMKSKLLDAELFGLCTKFERSFVAFEL